MAMNDPQPTHADDAEPPMASLRDRILATASALFYREGVHAVGVDLVVKESGIAKTSLYRHFGSKDALVTAFLEQEDQDFWRQWDTIADCYEDDPRGELEALLHWMDVRLRRPNYRGCPQLNVAAELPDPAHPARRVAAEHKERMRNRLSSIAERLRLNDPAKVGAQLALAFDGAFISAPFGQGEQLAATLRRTVKAIIDSARS